MIVLDWLDLAGLRSCIGSLNNLRTAHDLSLWVIDQRRLMAKTS